MLVLGPQPLLEVGPPPSTRSSPAASKRKNGTSSAVSSSAPTLAASSPLRRWNRPRAVAAGHTDPEGPAFETRGALNPASAGK